MKRTRQALIEIAGAMAEGQIERLRDLRKMVVDFDLTRAASDSDASLFTALYLAKRLTADVWENLATDASFEFDEAQLNSFAVGFGGVLQDIMSEGTKNHLLVNSLGETAIQLYQYFAEISADPSRFQKGGQK